MYIVHIMFELDWKGLRSYFYNKQHALAAWYAACEQIGVISCSLEHYDYVAANGNRCCHENLTRFDLWEPECGYI